MEDQVVTQAMTVVKSEIDPNQDVQMLALFDVTGTAVDLANLKGDKGDQGDPGADGADGVTPGAGDIVLTGLVAGSDTPITATDTLLVALANLQAQIDALAPS